MAYTAMFHAARAILFRDGIKERSHECIPMYIRQRYPGMAGQTNILNSYRIYRHEALYGLEFDPQEEDAIVAVRFAKELLSAVEKVLTDL
jgi:uncharacterized protein (UPF0332 family)